MLVEVSFITLTSLLLIPICTTLWLTLRGMPKKIITSNYFNMLILVSSLIIVHFIQLLFKVNFPVVLDVLFIFLLVGFYMQFKITKLFWQITIFLIGSAIVGVNYFISPIMSTILIICAAIFFYSKTIEMPLGEYELKFILISFVLSRILFISNMFVTGNFTLQASQTFFSIVSFLLFVQLINDYLISMLNGTLHSSITDGLTGLYNRNRFMTVANKCVSKGSESSIIFIDIDNFKVINDTFGHDEGDRVLKKVASVLHEVIEGYGISCRFGGEEFAAIILDEGDLVEITEQLRSRIEKEAGIINGGSEHKTTVSVGYTHYQEGISLEEFIKNADDAMYVAKKTGKNKVVQYGSEEFILFKSTLVTSAAV